MAGPRNWNDVRGRVPSCEGNSQGLPAFDVFCSPVLNGDEAACVSIFGVERVRVSSMLLEDLCLDLALDLLVYPLIARVGVGLPIMVGTFQIFCDLRDCCRRSLMANAAVERVVVPG